MKTIVKLIRMAYDAIGLLKDIKEQNDKILQQNEELLDSRRELTKALNTSMIIKKDYLTEEEAALYMDTTVSYIKTLIRGKGQGSIIPFYQPSDNNRYISRLDLDRYIISSRRMSASELAAESQRPSKRKRHI